MRYYEQLAVISYYEPAFAHDETRKAARITGVTGGSPF